MIQAMLFAKGISRHRRVLVEARSIKPQISAIDSNLMDFASPSQ